MIARSGRMGKRQDRHRCRGCDRGPPRVPPSLTNSSITSYCCPISDKRAPSWNARQNPVASGPGLPSSTRIPQPPAPRGLERIGPERIASQVGCLRASLSIFKSKSFPAGRSAGFFFFAVLGSFPSSPAGLTRGSILFARKWIAPELGPARVQHSQGCRKPAIPDLRCQARQRLRVRNPLQCKVATAAPYIALGLSTVPLCTITAASSMPSSNSWIGRLQVALLPFQVPSFTQCRATLW